MRRAEEANARWRRVVVGSEVVTRPAGPGSATVHSLLRHLRGAGLECVPEPLDLDDTTETLRFVEGDSGGDAWAHQHDERGLASAARLLRTVHDAARGWRPPAGAVWGAPMAPGPDPTYCHGDPGPWNFVWRDGLAVALLDWDYLHRGPASGDVAYALHWFAPLRSDDLALRWHHFPEVPDRRERVRAFLRAYGALPGPELAGADLAEMIAHRVEVTAALVRRLAEQGQEPQRTWVAEGAVERHADEVRWIREHRDLLT